MKTGTCPKCDSNEIMANITVHDVGNSGPYPLRAAIQEPEPAKHGPFWLPKEAKGDLRAWICSQCGYTEIYTSNLAEMYALYKSIQS